MNARMVILVLMLLVGAAVPVAAQGNQDSLVLRVENYGVVSNGPVAPLWSIHGKDGLRPLRGTSTQLLLGGSYSRSYPKGWSLYSDIKVVGSTGRTPWYLIQTAGIGVRNPVLDLSVGAFPYQHPLGLSSLTSGEMTLSRHAPPIPQLLLRTNGFVSIPRTGNWVSMYIDGSVGKFLDDQLLSSYFPDNEHGRYTRNPLWHHKSFYLRVGRKEASFPLVVTIGGVHAAQWGGRVLGEEEAKPHSFKDFLRVILGKRGGKDASKSDQINTLGNQFGHYVVQLDYYSSIGKFQAYHQHYYEDKSGLEWSNGPDGLWGIRWCVQDKKGLVNDVLFEYLTTKDQSGGFHILKFHRPEGQGRGGGNDNYYNNSEYSQGLTYYGMGIGNALLLCPMYNRPLPIHGGFRDNRVQAFHFGMGGSLLDQIRYKMRFSYIESWGTMTSPRDKTAKGYYGHLEVETPISLLDGLSLYGEVGIDRGDLSPKTIGCGIGIRYCPRIL